MTTSATLNYVDPVPARRARLWPGVAIILLMWIIIIVPAHVVPLTMMHFMTMWLTPIVAFLALLIWWLGFSRFSWPVKWVGLAALIIVPIPAFVAAHPSMRMPMTVFALPITNTAFLAAAMLLAYGGQGTGLRAGLIVIPMLVWGFFDLRRMDGLWGDVHASTSWRWIPNDEERYLAMIAKDPSLAGKQQAGGNAAGTLALSDGDWPAFRGPNRDGKLTGVSINKDWAQHPPKLVWKHLIGPGWGSCAVVGDHIFTQQQLGPSETVVCYNLNTGDQIWMHTDDNERFEESMGGPGPRATPTFADGKLYTLGAKTGRLNCLDPLTGKVIWSRSIAADTGAKTPPWGFSSSPLVANGLVTVMSGAAGKSVDSYNALTGAPVWSAGDGWSYASVQLSRLDGVEQLLAVTNSGISAYEPLHGQVLWTHSFPVGGANRAVQPTVADNNDVLIGAAFGFGTRKIHVTHTGNSWTNTTVWTAKNLKPYYNDMVFDNGYLYGFDTDVFTCVDVAEGKQHWRAHEYGSGQVLLIADQHLLLIMSEEGEAALVDASPAGWHELGRFQAVNGKTWNHPVIAHGKLVVRNGDEIACYDVK